MKARIRITGIALTVLTAALVLSAVPAGIASADNGTIGAVATPSWQTNGKVWSIAYTGGVIYAGGDFTSVRPPGNALGVGEVARSHLVGFDGTTLAPTSFNHTFDGSVYVVEASPDGSRIYVGGTFNNVDGIPHAGVVAFNTSDGSIVSGFSPQVSGSVRGFAFIGSTVYFGGSFGAVNTIARSNLAAMSTAGVLSTTWHPTTDGTVFGMAATSDNARVVITGSFDTVNSSAYHAIGALDPTTGATQTWAAKEFPTCSVGKDVIVRGTTVYIAAEGTGGGCFDGVFAVNQSTTQTIWKNNCLGGTQAIEVIGSYLYKASHAHDCSSDPNGFPQIIKHGDTRHLLSEHLSDGTLGNWWPNTNGKPLGGQALATDGTRLFLGGDFTTVNTNPQQGFAIFGQDPATNYASPKKPGTPTATSVTSGKVIVTFSSNFDIDDSLQSYLIYRDSNTCSATPIGSVQASSQPWNTPPVTFIDTGVVPGSQHSYRVCSTDGVHRSPITPASNVVTVSSAAPQSYVNTVNADSPFLYWRLADTSGSTAADGSGHNRTGTYAGTVTKNQTGALTSDTNKAVSFNGSTGYVYANNSVTNPQTYTVEGWFKTTTTQGGKIIGFGNNRTSLSTSMDRQIYMLNNGKLVYGVYNGSTQTIQSANAYNNGAWHQVAATLGPNGMALYVDGSAVGSNLNTLAQNFTGYWRVGGDQLAGWPNKPTSNFFNGTIDEVSVYSSQLTPAQIYTHYSAGIT